MHDAKRICDIFSEEFIRNFSSSSACRNNSEVPLPTQNFELKQINIDQRTVLETLCSTSDCAAGPDGLPGIFFKTLAPCLAQPLTIIYQQSIFQKLIPDDWRVAKIFPIYKGKDDKLMASSYRPVNLTAVACKILERIVVNQLTQYLCENDLFCDEQHGFRPKRSTVTSLLSCDAVISNYLINGSFCDMIVIEFASI